MPVTAPYGSWKSPITGADLAAAVVQPSFPTIHDGEVYWVERRPSEGGRHVLVGRSADGALRDVTPPGHAARSTVNDNGGRCYALKGRSVFFCEASDQRIYRIDGGGEPLALTPEPPAPGAWRYADLVVAWDGSYLLCVRELEADGGEVVTDLVAVPTAGGGEPVVLASGHDFYASPAVDTSGRRLAYIAWDHPLMPWHGTRLYEARLTEHLGVESLRTVAGGDEESIAEPSYSPDGRLHFVSDLTGWWNLYYEGDGRALVALAPMEAELTLPGWVLGLHSYGFVADGSIVARWRKGAFDHLGTIADGLVTEIETGLTTITSVEVAGDRVVVLGGSPTCEQGVSEVDLRSGALTVLRAARPAEADPVLVSVPEQIDFPNRSGLTSHALYYPPANAGFSAPQGSFPPLIVTSHAGPTMVATALLDYRVQYWTSRGYAVVDVNYGGSTGYGREYRDRLHHGWGVVDVDDCCDAALHLAERGLADRERLLIHGGSAGGFTTLSALTFRDVFAAGASYYGVSDLASLVDTSHKFESHYNDWLVGEWPEERSRFEERSPLLHAAQIQAPLILFQGLQDKVVPPAQSETMVTALRDNGVPFAYVVYPDEGHGFRRAENIVRTVEAELYFYGVVLGLEPADEIEPVAIENRAALRSVARSGAAGGSSGEQTPRVAGA